MSKSKEDNGQIELRSNEVQVILSKPPAALVRYGTVLICIILTVLIISSFFFKYPDVVSGTATIKLKEQPGVMKTESSHVQNKLYCVIKVPVSQSGRIKVGQQVNISIEGYSNSEYGFVKGVVNGNLSKTVNQFFLVEADLTKGLTTTNRKSLKITDELRGTAQIYTDNRSIFERLFGSFYNFYRFF
jgi:hypothetical protein